MESQIELDIELESKILVTQVYRKYLKKLKNIENP